MNPMLLPDEGDSNVDASDSEMASTSESLRDEQLGITVDVIKDRLAVEDVLRRSRFNKIAGCHPALWEDSLSVSDPDGNTGYLVDHATITIYSHSQAVGHDDLQSIRWPHQCLHEKDQQAGSLKSMAITRNGKVVATGFSDGAIIFWELSTSTAIRPSSVHTGSVYALAFSPDGTEVVSGSTDTTVIVRRAIAGGDGGGLNFDDWELCYLEAHETEVTVVVYSPNGSRLVSGSLDGVLNIWDASQKSYPLCHIYNMTCPRSVLFSPDSRKIVTTMDDIAIVWDSATGRTLATMRGHEDIIHMAVISHDGCRLATASEDQTARIWEIETGWELVTLHEHSGPVWCIAFSLDDSEVVTGSSDATIVIASSWYGSRRAAIDSDGPVNALAYSRSGEWICYGTIEGSVGLIDARSGEHVAVYKGHKDKVRSVAFSSEADSIISCSEDGTIRIFSVVDVLRLRELNLAPL